MRDRARDAPGPRREAAVHGAAPGSGPAEAIVLALQRTAGNHAVADLLSAPRQAVARGGTPAPSFPIAKPTPPAVPAGDVITVAVDLFAASATAKTPAGKPVLAMLRAKQTENEIGHEELDPQGKDIAGTAREGIGSVGRNDIAVDEPYRSNVVMTSTILVHEAMHLVLAESTLDEEVKGRSLEIDYYNELNAGVTVSGVVCVVPNGFDPDIEKQRDMRKNDRLIDFVVSYYYNRSKGFDAAWVAAHIKDWGGIPNRLPFTKGEYVKRLLEAAATHAEILLQLLESEAGNAANFKAIVEQAGGQQALYDGLHLLRFATGYWLRIEAIQKQTGVDLGAKR